MFSSLARDDVQIESYSRDMVRVLEISGDVDLHTERTVEAAVLDALRAGPVVLDLHLVPFFAISGLRMLLRCRRRGQVYGHPLILAAPRPQLLRLVMAANLTRQLPQSPRVGIACARARHIDRARNPGPRDTAA